MWSVPQEKWCPPPPTEDWDAELLEAERAASVPWEKWCPPPPTEDWDAELLARDIERYLYLPEVESLASSRLLVYKGMK